MDQLSTMSPLMGVNGNPGTADAGTAVAWPDTTVADSLSPKLVDCSLLLQSQLAISQTAQSDDETSPDLTLVFK